MQKYIFQVLFLCLIFFYSQIWIIRFFSLCIPQAKSFHFCLFSVWALFDDSTIHLLFIFKTDSHSNSMRTGVFFFRCVDSGVFAFWIWFIESILSSIQIGFTIENMRIFYYFICLTMFSSLVFGIRANNAHWITSTQYDNNFEWDMAEPRTQKLGKYLLALFKSELGIFNNRVFKNYNFWHGDMEQFRNDLCKHTTHVPNSKQFFLNFTDKQLTMTSTVIWHFLQTYISLFIISYWCVWPILFIFIKAKLQLLNQQKSSLNCYSNCPRRVMSIFFYFFFFLCNGKNATKVIHLISKLNNWCLVTFFRQGWMYVCVCGVCFTFIFNLDPNVVSIFFLLCEYFCLPSILQRLIFNKSECSKR